MDSVKQLQVAEHLQQPPIGPLSLRERARVRAAIPQTRHKSAKSATIGPLHKQTTELPTR
jgi:hypothetical protein